MEPYSEDPPKEDNTWDFSSISPATFTRLKTRVREKFRSKNSADEGGLFQRFGEKILKQTRALCSYLAPIIRSFSPREKLVFIGICGILALSSLGLLFKASSFFMVEIPEKGGSFTEGVIGTPRFINPLLALSDTDRDLTQLIYSGLLRAKADGELIPDLAESFEISEDGLVYT